jgi:HAD superfamily hydrolase (TIGR01509 family)
VDGTIAETERDGHRVAFNRAFEERGLSWHWDEIRYGELLRVAGGRERLLHDMAGRDDAPESPGEREALAQVLHLRKNAIYAGLAGGGRIPLRPGVRELMEECRTRGVRLGIATTTSRANVGALLAAQLGPRWSNWFDAIVCGEDVVRKKPDPAVYEAALRGLGVGPLAAVAIEDSPAGLEAARAAGIPAVVTRSWYFTDVPLEGALAVGAGLDQPVSWRPSAPGPLRVGLDDIRRWRAAGAAPSLLP